MHVDDGTGTNHNMQCECRARQELSMQASARAFNANKWILCDTEVSIAQKLGYFDRVISTVACFAAGHRNYGCCISATSPISGEASSQYGLDITMA